MSHRAKLEEKRKKEEEKRLREEEKVDISSQPPHPGLCENVGPGDVTKGFLPGCRPAASPTGMCVHACP